MTLQNRSPKPDVASLMEQIRANVRAELALKKDALQPFKPKRVELDEIGKIKAGELVNSEDLLFLNRNYVLSGRINPASFVTHRKGILGRLVLFFKRRLAKVIQESILNDYISGQQEFFAHLVRYLNKTAVYVDSRDSDIFWQLIHKIDTDVGRSTERIERIRDEVLGASQTIEKNSNRAIQDAVEQINSALGSALAIQQQHGSELKTLDSVVRGFEGIIAQSGKRVQSDAAGLDKSAEPELLDQSYVLLENRFRGSQEEIKVRQEMYAAYFKGVQKPILDVGCGRGELLGVLRDHEVPAFGIDLDAAMVEHSRAKNLNAEKADLLSFLRKAEDDSLGGLIALQVVEHLPREVLNEFVELANRKVVPGGLVIFETINPTSMTALSSNYFRDPTHVFPQHPDTLGFLMTTTGLDLIETKFLAAVPAEAQLRELNSEVYMTPRWNQTVALFNHNIRILNSVLFGFQDYCVIGRVRNRN